MLKTLVETVFQTMLRTVLDMAFEIEVETVFETDCDLWWILLLVKTVVEITWYNG